MEVEAFAASFQGRMCVYVKTFKAPSVGRGEGACVSVCSSPPGAGREACGGVDVKAFRGTC